MKFQLALDFGSVPEILKIIEQTAAVVDIIEIGTPLIIEYGMVPVRAVKAEFPHLTVLSDTKIMDAGEYEADIAFNAGADIVTVMGVSNNETVKGAISSAKRAGGDLMVDMMCVPNLSERSAELKKFGARYLCVHTAKDVQEHQNPFNDLANVQQAVGSSHTAVAGGISHESLVLLREYSPEIVIVGGAVTGSPDPAAAAIRIGRAFEAGEGGDF